MINKKNLWFLMLFSLILVLSVYYITMPNELLLTNTSDFTNVDKEIKDDVEVVIEESELLTSLRVESDEQVFNEMEDLKEILTNSDAAVEEKNEAFENMKLLNTIKAEEQLLEEKVKENFNYKTFIKIDGDNIRVVIDDKKHSVELANKIMRSIQEKYEVKKYITVKFQI